MDNTILGFTGTRNGMTEEQREVVQEFIKNLVEGLSIVALHGDCVGADKDFHNICRRYGLVITARPSIYPSLRAYTDAEVLAPPEKPLSRNHKIVNDCQVLLACPSTDHELTRSGTWSTIRAAREANKQVYIAYPDGTLVEDCPGPLVVKESN